MLIKLTNANPQHNDQTLVLNSDHIVTMYEERLPLGTTLEYIVTCIFVPPHGTWHVKERLEDICQKLAEDPREHLLKAHEPAGLTTPNSKFTVAPKPKKTAKKPNG